MDSAIKGGAILALAACLAILLRRDSAATRHLVWFVAIIALLVVPVFSALLPHWRVLPAWAAISQGPPAIEVPARAVELPAQFPASLPEEHGEPRESYVPTEMNVLPPAAETFAQPSIDAPTENRPIAPEPSTLNWNWLSVLPILWSIGFSFLIFRLMAARWILWCSERRATVISLSGRRNAAKHILCQDSDRALVSAFEDAYQQLGVRQPVRLLIHSQRTIPVIWGIFRFSMLLPGLARQWNREQLQSVLLHELAHIKRRDTIVQLLAQIACALHWFNPLVWYAAWRLHVERERACDDLVLAQGVRASAYAEHLLNVATKLSVARWTSACGLAMASRSPLESRLHAILSDRLNRRKVSTAIGMIGLLLGAGIAIPIAMLRAADEQWNPHQAAHISTNDFSAYCVHDGKDAAFVIAYHGDFGSATESVTNPKTRTWTNSGTITAKQPGIALSFHRTHTAPGKLSITTAPAEGRDLSKPAPPPRKFGQSEFDLTQGHVFLLSDNGDVRQLDLPTPVVTDQESAKKLAALIAAIPPEDEAQMVVLRDVTVAFLLNQWQESEGRKTPLSEASIARLRVAIDKWVKQPTAKPDAARVTKLRDWQDTRAEHPVAEVKAWLDEIASIHPGSLAFAISNEPLVGEVLSAERQAALEFGPAAENGLRAAWSRYPVRETYAPGDVVSSTLVMQNVSEQTIEFECPHSLESILTWEAKSADGRTIESKPWRTTGTFPLFTWQLKPGAYAEIYGRGVLVGESDRPGGVNDSTMFTLLEAKRGQQVTVHWKVREPVEMTTGEVTFKVVGIEDMPVWSTSQAGNWPMPGGVTLEVKQQTVHAADIMSNAILTWPIDKAGGTARHRIFLGGDAFSNRDPWLLAWERGASVLWEMSGQMQSPQTFHKVKPTPTSIRRIDFSNPKDIKETTWYYLPDLVPGAIRAEFDREFLPLVATPPAPADANSSVQSARAEDVRPVTELLSGTWKSAKGETTVRIAFSGKATDAVIWTIDFGNNQKTEIINETLGRMDSPLENAVLLTKPRLQPRTPGTATLGRLKRGIDDTLLLDIKAHVDFPEYQNSYGIVLVRDSAPELKDEADVVKPKHKDAQSLYEIWQRYARTNGDIPGALVGELAAAVKQFIKYNPTWETVPKLNELLPRLDATHDWKPADAIALLDEVAGIQDSPIKAAPWRGTRHTIRNGDALPKKYADVLWGEEQPNGLRAAWVLEPSATEYRIGTALNARLLVQNRGQVPVMLHVPTFHQGWVKGTDATGSEVQVSGISWTTRAQLVPVRLAPGEHIEINTPGVGIGPRAGMGPWAGPRVGSNVLAKPGDELTLTYSLVPLDGSEVGVSEEDPHVSGPGWWLAHIKTRLDRELPLPTDAVERARLLDRAVRELFATAPTAEETEAFIADQTPDALDALAKRLAERADVVSFSGKLPTAPVKFRVLDADANADKQPRVVLGPGEYPLSEGTATSGAVTLKIIGRPVGDRRTNDAGLLFEATEATGKLALDPYKLEIPDGWGTWAIVCRPSDGFFYLLHKGSVRKIDYSKPRNVTDTLASDLPAEFRDEVKRILDIHEISETQQAEIFEKPLPPAASVRADEQEEPQIAATLPQPKAPEQREVAETTTQPDWVLAWDFRISPLDQQYSKMRISSDGHLETIHRKPPMLRTQLSSDEVSELVALVANNPQAKSRPLSKIAEYSKAISPTPELFEALKKVQVRSEIVAVVHEDKLFELDLNTTEAMAVDVQLKKFVGLAAIGGSEVLSRLVELANQELKLKYPDLTDPILPTHFYDGKVDQPLGKIAVWFNYRIDPESSAGQMVLLRISENGRPTIKQVILPRIVGLDELDKTEWNLPNAEFPLPTREADQDAAKLAELDVRITALQIERLKLSETLSPNHPKLRAIDAEIRTFEDARIALTSDEVRDETPLSDKLAELDAKIAALQIERLKLSETLTPNHPKIRAIDAEIRTLEKARALLLPESPPANPSENMLKLPDDQYVKSGFPVDELVGEGVIWNDEQNGLSLGYRITGNEWRILGKKVKVELWVQNLGDKDVKFQLNMRPDIGLRPILIDAKGEGHSSNTWPNDTPPFGEHRLLPPGHALQVKEFTVSLLWPDNDVSSIKGHFFAIDPGTYNFHCELELPGLSATGEGGKQLTPAAGEWTGTLTTRVLNVEVIAPDALAPKPRTESPTESEEVDISTDG
ncbi:MAG: M56 family metallopeptidase [Pirellulaceae bacterium]|nr:M56 family metallopeptidase [Pirellulaceae bacterium]